MLVRIPRIDFLKPINFTLQLKFVFPAGTRRLCSCHDFTLIRNHSSNAYS